MGLSIRRECPIQDSNPRALDQPRQEANIVQADEAAAEILVGPDEVMQISNGEPRARGAIAFRIQWVLPPRKWALAQVELSAGGKRRAVPPESGGQHTIEH